MDFNEAILLDESKDIYWYNRAKAKLKLNFNTEALQDIQNALKINKDKSDYYLLEGEILFI